MKGKTIIVAGGAGFIGSNLVERLCVDNTVVVIDNMHTGSEDNLRDAMKSGRVRLIKDDVRNINKLGIKADLVFHLGFYSSAPMYHERPERTAEVVAGMIEVLEYARGNGCNVVFSATSSIYNSHQPPHSEELAPLVTDYYTEGRYACERIAQLYAKLHGVNVAAMRFFSVYGRHERAKAGYANLVTQFIWAMREGRQPVVYGNGEQRRDFIMADDVVDAMLAAKDIQGYGVFNVGTGTNYSINELITMLNSKMGTSISPKYVDIPMSNYVMETKADTSKAERILGFKASIQLEEGLKRMLEAY